MQHTIVLHVTIDKNRAKGVGTIFASLRYEKKQQKKNFHQSVMRHPTYHPMSAWCWMMTSVLKCYLSVLANPTNAQPKTNGMAWWRCLHLSEMVAYAWW